MSRRLRFLAVLVTVLGMVVAGGSSFAVPKDKGQDQKGQKDANASNEKKQHKYLSGKDLVGDKIKKNGSQKIHEHGKYATFVNVSNGRITGVNVKHPDKGDVPVTKYKTTTKMAQGSTGGIQLASYVLAQSQYVGTLWIGYAFIDDWGYEVIYWFPYDMIYDGDTGAIWYEPAY